MAAAKRKPNSALIDKLLREPGAFDFFRAIQVLETSRLGPGGRRARPSVGFDHPVAEVGDRFGVASSLAFPACALTEVEIEDSSAEDASGYRLLVSCFGLVGPAGTLPAHYTETVLQRLHAKDESLRDFLDLFHERAVALFYRAWKKYRLAASFDSTDRASGRADPVLTSVLALVGLHSRSQGHAITAESLTQVHHAGLFSNRRRSAHGLRAMLRGLLRCEVEIEQFVGQWVELDSATRSRLGEGPGPGTPARLGEEAVLGSRVWSVDSRLRIVAGPLDRGRFRELWPGGDPVQYLREVVRAYLGPLLEFDLVWRLAPSAPAGIALGGGQRLGRDSWLGFGESDRADTLVISPTWHNFEPHEEGTRSPSSRRDFHTVPA
jgi:type VI secretion system protein ImpH